MNIKISIIIASVLCAFGSFFSVQANKAPEKIIIEVLNKTEIGEFVSDIADFNLELEVDSITARELSERLLEEYAFELVNLMQRHFPNTPTYLLNHFRFIEQDAELTAKNIIPLKTKLTVPENESTKKLYLVLPQALVIYLSHHTSKTEQTIEIPYFDLEFYLKPGLTLDDNLKKHIANFVNEREQARKKRDEIAKYTRLTADDIVVPVEQRSAKIILAYRTPEKGIGQTIKKAWQQKTVSLHLADNLIALLEGLQNSQMALNKTLDEVTTEIGDLGGGQEFIALLKEQNVDTEKLQNILGFDFETELEEKPQEKGWLERTKEFFHW